VDRSNVGIEGNRNFIENEEVHVQSAGNSLSLKPHRPNELILDITAPYVANFMAPDGASIGHPSTEATSLALV